MDAEAVNGLLDFFVKRPAGMRSFASGVAGWHVLLLFYSNALFSDDGITLLIETHLQEPWPKRNLGEAPEAISPAYRRSASTAV